MEIQDTALLAKLAPGDMIALEAKYHLKCLVKLYNRARVADSTGADDDPNGHLHNIAFTELVAYMEDFCMEESVSPVFQLADLTHMYKARLALEAKYHLKCLVKRYNRARVADSTGADDDPNGHLHDIAFTELVAYMEDFCIEESVSPVFQLADLTHMYKARLEQLWLRAEFTLQD
ncbi:UNVERIFIED_CONTAM: hypothetical protein FKN15_067568 [Acipenser sinensis]